MFIYEHVYQSKIVLFLKGRQHNVLNETIFKEICLYRDCLPCTYNYVFYKKKSYIPYSFVHARMRFKSELHQIRTPQIYEQFLTHKMEQYLPVHLGESIQPLNS